MTDVTKEQVKATLQAAITMLQAVQDAVDKDLGTTEKHMNPKHAETVIAAGLAVGKGTDGTGCTCSR